MKIAFVGDSFCADSKMTHDSITNRIFDNKKCNTWLSWVELVAQNYNAEIICTGHSGRALFHAYEDLLDIIDEADYIVLCITKEFRLPNKYRIGITPSTISKFNHPRKKLQVAAISYYEEVMSIDFHSTIHYLLIKEIDNLLQERNKKCIWFFVDFFQLTANPDPTQDWMHENSNKYLAGKSYKIKSGPVGDTTLSSLANFDLRSSYDLDHVSNGTNYNMFKEIGLNEFDVRLNHLNEKNNIHMAKLITDMIDNDDFTLRKIKMSNYFKMLECVPEGHDLPWNG